MITNSRAAVSLAGVWAVAASSVLGTTTLPVVNPGFEDTTGSVSIFNEFSFSGYLGWEVYDNPPGLVGAGASKGDYSVAK